MTYVKTLDTTIYSSEDFFERDYLLVPKYRQKKIDRYHFNKDKCLSLGAGILLSNALSDCGYDENNLSLSLTEHEKPYFKDICDHFSFSLSHSGDIAMIAYSFDKDNPVPEIGCDIEYMKKADLNIAKRFFSKDECDLIFSQICFDAQNDMFYRLWTLHESFMKATGLGLSISSEDFSFDLSQNGVINVIQSVNSKSYRFEELNILNGYKASLCEEIV